MTKTDIQPNSNPARLAEAEAIARATGSRAATVTVERVEIIDGVREVVVESSDTFTKPVAADLIDNILTAIGVDADTEETARMALEELTTDQLTETLANVEAQANDQADLRARLMDDLDLRVVVCPHTTWGTPLDRFTVAQGALRILEGQAKANDLTTAELVAAITANGDSVRQTIEAYGDPRYDGVHGSKTGFYAWRCRVKEGVATATVETRKAAAERKRVEEDARWERMGLTRCERCGGAGGHDGWPGFTCYDCGGQGATV